MRIRDLSTLSYAQGFTLWHYRDNTATLRDMQRTGFWDAACCMFNLGDVVFANGADGTGIMRVALVTTRPEDVSMVLMARA